MSSNPGEPKRKYVPPPSGLWPGSSPELIAAHERALSLVSADDQAPHEVRATTRWATSFLALITLTVTCGLISLGFDSIPGIRLEEGSVLRSKYEHFSRFSKEMNTAFVGSSHTYRHVDPGIFDREVSAVGEPNRSFNLGARGLYMPEVLHTVKWVLEQDLPNLRWIFIELRELPSVFVAENELSRREINWHRASLLPEFLEIVWDSDETTSEKWLRTRWTFRHVLYREGNLSLAYPLFAKLTGQTKPSKRHWIRKGFYPLEVEAQHNPGDASLSNRRRLLKQFPESYAAKLEEWYASPADKQPSETMLAIHRKLVRWVRDAGMEPVFFLGVPDWSKSADIIASKDRGALPCLFHYNNPDLYPQFHDIDRLFDLRHLKNEGAEEFSQRLTSDFLEYISEQ